MTGVWFITTWALYSLGAVLCALYDREFARHLPCAVGYGGVGIFAAFIVERLLP